MQRLAQRMLVLAFAMLVSTPLLLAVDSQSPRQVLAADLGWKFFLGDPSGAEAPSFADVSWRTVNLPHDWSIEGPFDEKNPTKGAGGFLPAGAGWYRKHFTLPASQGGGWPLDVISLSSVATSCFASLPASHSSASLGIGKSGLVTSTPPK